MKFSREIDDKLFIDIESLISILNKYDHIVNLNLYKKLVNELHALNKRYISIEKLQSGICSEPEEGDEGKSVHNEKLLLLKQ